MKLHAEILPNDRKYYGTEIKLTTEDGREAEFNVWINGLSEDYAPSVREYDFVGKDGKFYVRFEDDDEAYEYETCNDHYETATALHICRTIVASLDGLEI